MPEVGFKSQFIYSHNRQRLWQQTKIFSDVPTQISCFPRAKKGFRKHLTVVCLRRSCDWWHSTARYSRVCELVWLHPPVRRAGRPEWQPAKFRGDSGGGQYCWELVGWAILLRFLVKSGRSQLSVLCTVPCQESQGTCAVLPLSTGSHTRPHASSPASASWVLEPPSWATTPSFIFRVFIDFNLPAANIWFKSKISHLYNVFVYEQGFNIAEQRSDSVRKSRRVRQVLGMWTHWCHQSCQLLWLWIITFKCIQIWNNCYNLEQMCPGDGYFRKNLLLKSSAKRWEQDLLGKSAFSWSLRFTWVRRQHCTNFSSLEVSTTSQSFLNSFTGNQNKAAFSASLNIHQAGCVCTLNCVMGWHYCPSHAHVTACK